MSFSMNNLQNSLNAVSTSPTQSYMSTIPAHLNAAKQSKALKPFSSTDYKVLLLENVNQKAVEIFENQGYQVDHYKGSFSNDELIEKIKDVHAIGIRSKTKLTRAILEKATNLKVIGCFCIGTNQVDLQAAAELGIAVFNSPFSNSRSVAELVICEIIALARQLGDRSIELHTGTWNKVSARCWEVRGKVLGIVGYGHIGSQLSVLAESLGLHVIYYDILTLMSLGTAHQTSSLDELLRTCDFLSLHVPETPDTKNLIGAPQLAAMKKGAYIINASRGTVVDIEALVMAMEAGKIAGAALDVFPKEPKGNGADMFNDELNNWTSRLVSLPNVILSPHIGGSTEEAQCAIGIEVSNALTKYINEGTSTGSVNFPEVALRGMSLDQENTVRVLYIHKNIPGVLKTVNNILSNHNIEKQFSDSSGDIAYLIADIADVNFSDIKDIHDKLDATEARIKIRVLY